MRNLSNYVLKCELMLDEMGIKYGIISDVTVNTRAKHRWGQCNRNGNRYSINISSLLLEERNSEEGLINTILHELLHTVSGCMNHGKKWQELANRVSYVYNLNIRRTSSKDEVGLCKECKKELEEEQKQKLASMPVYKLICKECGNTYTYRRAGYYVQHYKDCWCHLCKGKLDLIKG